MDFDVRPFGQGRVGNDDAIGDDARYGGGHESYLVAVGDVKYQKSSNANAGFGHNDQMTVDVRLKHDW